MYNFGSPRIFNWPLVVSVQATIPVIFRIARYKDLFVHLPPCKTDLLGRCEKGQYGAEAAFLATDAEPLTWNPFWSPYHIAQNIFYTTEDDTQYKLCNGGEDPKCADQYSPLSCTIDDHLEYIGVRMGQCAIKNYLWIGETA